MTKVTGGKYYRETNDGDYVEVDAPATPPDTWICRRVADFPGRVLPAGTEVTRCCLCGIATAYNPAREVDAPKSCMQCNGIEPEPMT